MPSAAEVGPKYDVLINSQGYRFLEDEKRAAYGISPTFVTRQNVQGNYGDNQQDFWLTFSQNDWSLGEGQRYFRSDEERSRRYWLGDNVLVEAGGIKANYATRAVTMSAAVRAVCPRGAAVSENIVAAGTTNLFEVDADGTETDRGAHGLGAAPARNGLCTDSSDIYMSTTAAGTVGVRKMTGASTFSTFSASPADSLAFLNNTLYGFRADTWKLVKWDSSGTQSDIFQWKQVDGAAAAGTDAAILAPFGGKLLILFPDGPTGSELWLYDGVAPAMVASFGRDFFAASLAVVHGQAFVGGSFVQRRNTATNVYLRPAVMYYANGTVGELWRATQDVSAAAFSINLPHAAVAEWGGGLVIASFGENADAKARLLHYSAASGGIAAIGSFSNGANGVYQLAATKRFVFCTANATGAALFPKDDTAATAFLRTSLIDFDSSLTKYFKSVRVEFEQPTSPQTLTVSYQLDKLEAAFTDVTTNAVSGTEYSIGQSGRAVGIKIAWATANNSPVVRRVHVRAAPIQDTFKKRQYVLDLSGKDGESPIVLRDGTLHTKDGVAMATDLNTAMVATTPFSITDRFGTFTGLIEPDSSEIIEVRPEVFVARITVREV